MDSKFVLRTWRFGAVVLLAGGVVLLSAATATMPPTLVVVNQGDHDISLIDPAAERQTATVDVQGITGHEAVVSPDGRTAYVPIYGNAGVGRAGSDGDKIVAIDLAAKKISGTVQFDHGVRPHCIRYNPHDGLLYVTTELNQSITLIDPGNLKIVGSISTGQDQSHMLVLDHAGLRGYTANVGPGTVTVLDLKSRKPVRIIPVSKDTQRISISNDDRLVFTADQMQPRLAVIDTATSAVKTWIALPGLGYGTAPTKDGRWLLVAMRPLNEIAVVDLHSLKVVRTVDTAAVPTEILVRPDGKVAYISCTGAGQVAVLNLADWKIEGMIAAGKSADGLAWGQ